MLIPTIVIGLLAMVILFISYQKGVHIQGLKATWNMLIQMLPILVFAMILAGAIQNLVPSDLISRWVGAESGFRGVIIGAAMGVITPGGPYISLPTAAALMRSGANIGTMVSFMTAWALLGFVSLPMQIGIMGWKFTAIRIVCVFFFAPVAGLIANTFFSRARII